MENIASKSNLLIQGQNLGFIRSLAAKIDWKDRLIGILGARGTGKTTLLLQHIKQHYGIGGKAIYLTLDDIYFTEHKLVDFAEQFRLQGGEILFLDEVHKYPNWATEIKNLYDFYSDLRIVFTGSSVTDLLRQNADLSRRVVQYELTGLSYREFLEVSGVVSIPPLSLQDIIDQHVHIANDLSTKFKPLQYFNDYLQYGYYPFFLENKRTYFIRLEQVVKLIIENDLQFIDGFDSHNTRKIYQLLYILATNVPFKPNVSKLSEKTGMHRTTLLQYMHYLDKARLINTLTAAGKSISTLQKPDKIFLENTNLHHMFSQEKADKGALRESFFLNQLCNAGHEAALPLSGDFMVDGKYTFEIGGKGKGGNQIKDIPDSWIAADEIETGAWNKIPLWLFGFLY
ncbi:ATP-binding protein [Chitinophaga sp. XS-30]|uniref:ATP-binding protein n=1 Tax=Chitinophaga sp. XS-30 TaxID=2604421 RepID=UPI0011DE1F85|nr:AAA family ATPase [Chitinophaga sp. XS-30]QEH39634.1 ATP-binding protein [Chitinophaga sp. XS-30]